MIQIAPHVGFSGSEAGFMTMLKNFESNLVLLLAKIHLELIPLTRCRVIGT